MCPEAHLCISDTWPYGRDEALLGAGCQDKQVFDVSPSHSMTSEVPLLPFRGIWILGDCCSLSVLCSLALGRNCPFIPQHTSMCAVEGSEDFSQIHICLLQVSPCHWFWLHFGVIVVGQVGTSSSSGREWREVILWEIKLSISNATGAGFCPWNREQAPPVPLVSFSAWGKLEQ